MLSGILLLGALCMALLGAISVRGEKWAAGRNRSAAAERESEKGEDSFLSGTSLEIFHAPLHTVARIPSAIALATSSNRSSRN